MSTKNKISQEINLYNYWEHFKTAKDLSFVLPPEHPKRKQLEKTINELSIIIHNKK